MDLTWNDSPSTYGDLEQRHLYFGLTDELMAIVHSDHAKNYQAEGYAYRSAAPTNSYYVRNGKTAAWAAAYRDRIQQHLDAGETSFEINAADPHDPPSISGIKTGLIAWQMNQMDWATASAKVDLTAESVVTMTSSTTWTAKYEFTAKYAEPSAPKFPNIQYMAHVVWQGWQDSVKLGEVAGTVGQSLGMEALQIGCDSEDGSILVEGYSPAYGWQNWNESTAGTTGQSIALEVIRIKLTGKLADKYDIYYQTHIAWIGWAGWAKNGDPAGSIGYAHQLEALRIILVEKGADAPGLISDAFTAVETPNIQYAAHVANIGWMQSKGSSEIDGVLSSGNGVEA